MAVEAAQDLVTRAKFARPVSAEAVRRDWKARGFGCETFVDPPGREWNDFVHDTDELVTVLKGGRPAYEVAIEERHARGDFTEDV